MTTAPLRKEASRDQDEILALFDALRQAHHDKNASAIAAAYAGFERRRPSNYSSLRRSNS